MAILSQGCVREDIIGTRQTAQGKAPLGCGRFAHPHRGFANLLMRLAKNQCAGQVDCQSPASTIRLTATGLVSPTDWVINETITSEAKLSGMEKTAGILNGIGASEGSIP